MTDPKLDEFCRIAWKLTAWIIAILVLGAIVAYFFPPAP